MKKLGQKTASFPADSDYFTHIRLLHTLPFLKLCVPPGLGSNCRKFGHATAADLEKMKLYFYEGTWI